METLQPVFFFFCFAPLQDHLIAVLEELDTDLWSSPTTSSSWTVHEVTAHLLDGDLRRLSQQRDHHLLPAPEPPIVDGASLVAYLDQLNADWVRAAARLSPRILIDLLKLTGPAVAELFESFDPFAPAPYPVAWAGDEESPNWFDVARELTEKWVHQQQIREAAGRPILEDQYFLKPVLDTFLRAVPHAARAVPAECDTSVGIRIEGEAGGSWSLLKETSRWTLHAGAADRSADATVQMSQDTAWRFLSTRKRKAELLEHIEISGAHELCAGILGATAVMA